MKHKFDERCVRQKQFKKFKKCLYTLPIYKINNGITDLNVRTNIIKFLGRKHRSKKILVPLSLASVTLTKQKAQRIKEKKSTN